jgi:hypothetical protein
MIWDGLLGPLAAIAFTAAVWAANFDELTQGGRGTGVLETATFTLLFTVLASCSVSNWFRATAFVSAVEEYLHRRWI